MRILKCVFIVLAWLPTFACCYSQQYDSNYVHTFEKTKSIKLFVTQRKTETGFATSRDKIVFSPGRLLHTGIGGTYKNMQLLIAFGLEPDSKFYNKNRDIKLNLNFGYIGGAIQFKQSTKNKSYIISTSDKLKNFYENNSKIRLDYVGCKVFYIFNHPRYTIHAVYKQTQQQQRSAASVLIMGETGITCLQSDTFFIPGNLANRFASVSRFYSAEIKTGYILAGYTYSLVWPHKPQYYFTPVVLLGPGIAVGNYTGYFDNEKNRAFDLKADIRLLLGYTGKRFYAGSIIEADTNLKRKNRLHLQSRSAYWQFNLGYRF